LPAVEPEDLRFAAGFAFDPEAALALAVVARELVFFAVLAFFAVLGLREPDVVGLREPDVVRPDELRADVLRRLEVEPPDSRPLSLESSSPSEPISFLATPTAAGIATPSAVPATTFLVVDRPSSSLFDMVTSRDPA